MKITNGSPGNNLLYIDRHDGNGFRQYMFEPDDWAEVQRLMLEGIDKGWFMDYRPQNGKKDQG